MCDTEGNQIVDFIGRYENLEHDFNLVVSKIMSRRSVSLPENSAIVPAEVGLDRQNASRRACYRSHFNEKTAEMVRKWYRKDSEMFGYYY